MGCVLQRAKHSSQKHRNTVGYSPNIKLSICLKLISALERMWKGYRLSNELTSDNVSTVNETLRVTLNENASNFESFNGDKHHVPDAFYEKNSQFFS